MWPWKGKRRKKKQQQMPSVFVALGLVFVALVAAAVLQRTTPRPASVVQRLPPPDFAGILPPGAETSAGAALELPDAVQPAYVVGYRRADGAAVGLIAWDKDEKRYVLASSVILSSPKVRMESVPTLRSDDLGSGAPSVILARGSAGAYMDAVFVLTREGGALRLAAMRESDGTGGTAFFLVGASAQRSSSFVLHDADGDGDKEAIVETRELVDEKWKVRSEVYAWNDGSFDHDENLSWALTTSRAIFPEPPSEGSQQ